MAIFPIKLTIVGDEGVGKTTLGYHYLHGKSTDSMVRALENANTNVRIDGHVVDLLLCDTIGSDDYLRLRPLSYPNTGVFLLCFSVVDSKSFEKIQTQWYAEVIQHTPGVPYFLVGLKTDLRDDRETLEKLEAEKSGPISYEYGVKLAGEIRAEKYVECSALTCNGLREVFEEVLKVAIKYYQQKNPPPKQNNCTLS